ncbi:MAG: winged helix-turn-helix transcriptional regulator [Deinococcus sp.]
MTDCPNVLSRRCPSNGVLELISGKWSMLVVYALRGGKLRYSELHTVIEGISQKMLTQTLRELERDGLVSRRAYPVVPPHTEYALTPLGLSLHGIVCEMGSWAERHMGAVLGARAEYDEGRGLSAG